MGLMIVIMIVIIIILPNGVKYLRDEINNIIIIRHWKNAKRTASTGNGHAPCTHLQMKRALCTSCRRALRPSR